MYLYLQNRIDVDNMSELKVHIPNNVKSQLESTARDCFGKKNNALDIAVQKQLKNGLQKLKKSLFHRNPQKIQSKLYGVCSPMLKNLVSNCSMKQKRFVLKTQ